MKRIVAGLLFVAAAGCTDGNTLKLVATDTDVAGDYFLQAIDGGPLPVVAAASDTSETFLTADEFLIGADSTWTETSSYQVINVNTDSTTNMQTVISGVYHIDKVINFTTTVGGTNTFQGTVKGINFNLVFQNATFSYQK